MTLWEFVTSGWTILIFAVALALTTWAVAHTILTNRDPRSVILWVWFVTLVPLFGAILYFIFGINRIRRAGSRIKIDAPITESEKSGGHLVSFAKLEKSLESSPHLAPISTVLNRLASHPLTSGNSVDILEDGDEAYPAMIDAISAAEHSVAFSTYIFEWNGIGERFAAALLEAKKRGVQVRVIIDDFGTRYSWPSAVKHLDHLRIPVRRFMPRRHLLRLLTLNLRNHRKLLVVDGKTGFTGGMNIRSGHIIKDEPKHPVRDAHFKLRGPVVSQLMEVFAKDWAFCDGEILSGTGWFPKLESAGNALVRGIAEGPDFEHDSIFHTILAALSVARESVRIVTPYFLPPSSIVAALNVAAMRGVDVTIVLPEQNNIYIARWASRAGYIDLLEKGCKIYETAPPFDHSKIFVVDNYWSLVGSTNWDPRSLHLNFEFNIASFDADLAGRLSKFVDKRIASARPITFEEMRSRPLPIRLRDGIARVFTPAL